VFPTFNSISGAATIITVTNVNADRSFDPATRLQSGTIDVEFIYIDGETCQEFNRVERLTPNDTFSTIASSHNPNQAMGYLYAFAKDPITGEPVTFDWLIGHQQVIDGLLTIEYGTNVFTFNGIPDEGEATDLDGDGILDLDGIEYEMAPDQIVIPRFFGQGTGLESYLILINLTGGTRFSTTLDFLVHNDNEYIYSAEYEFDCWEMTSLVEISGVFRNDFLQFTDNDPNEILGLEMLESGWIRLDGGITNSGSTAFEDPAFLAFLFEFIGPFGGADLPFELGTQDNGDLLPRSVGGDS